MGWSQAVAGDSITRSYLQFVSIKCDGRVSKHKESYPVCCACQLKISPSPPPLPVGKLAISFKGGTFMAWSAGFGARAHHTFLFSQSVCIPASKAKGPQRFISLYLVGNCQVGCSSYLVHVSPSYETVSIGSWQNWFKNQHCLFIWCMTETSFNYILPNN